MQLVAHWQINAGACPSASVTLFGTGEIDGTTYTNDDVTFFIFADGWGITFPYYEVSLDLASVFHTATIVLRFP